MAVTRLGLAAGLLLAMMVDASAANVKAKSGVERMIGRNGSINSRTCQAMSLQPVIAQAARHGSVEFRLNTFKVTNRSSHCLGQEYRGFGIYYRSQPGFRGTDQVVISTFLSNGRTDVRTDYTYVITVQ